MDAAKELLGRVEVVVGLHPSLERFVSFRRNANEFRTRLEQYLDDLFEDLHLPSGLELTTMLCQEADRFPIDMTLYQVRIAGRPCRLELQPRTAETMSAAKLSRAVAKDIYCNRDLMLTPSLSETIRERWLSENGRSCFRAAPAEAFHDLLSLLVQRGSRVDRARELDQEMDIKGWSVRRKFEAIAASPAATAIRALLSPTLYEMHLKTDTAAQSTAGAQPFQDMLDGLDNDLFYDLGIILPAITVSVDESLEETEFRLQLNDLRLAPIDGLRLSEELRRNASHLLTTEVVECSLDLLSYDSPALVHATLERFEVPTLTQVMRDLLREDISIRNLRALLETLLSMRKPEPTEVAYYSRWVRADFKRYISNKYSRGQNTLVVYLLAAQLEGRIAASDQEPLTEDEHCRLLRSLWPVVEESSATAWPPVILTTWEARRKLRRLVEKELPSLAILSYQELSQDVNIQPVSRIEPTLIPSR